jgi:2-C-methyl-D-erythritol 2,4-cyclodiphosphate synthase
MQVGFGFDAHRFGGDGPLRLGGVVVDPDRSVHATSDGDVAIHALIDALLGGAALGDLGTHFPSTDERWSGADSRDLLSRVVAMVGDAGHAIAHVDVTIVAQTVRVAPHRSDMRRALASVLGIPERQVSVKATTTDAMGFLGRDEGVAAFAVATLGGAS